MAFRCGHAIADEGGLARTDLPMVTISRQDPEPGLAGKPRNCVAARCRICGGRS